MKIIALPLFPLLALLAACSSLDATQLVPSDYTATNQHPASVRIETEGSPRKMGLGARVISSEELLLALREAVLTSGVFERVIEEGSADYVLSVSVISIEKSEPGLDMTATADLRWSLRQTSSSALIWERSISTECETDNLDADFMQERGQMAIEGAVRANLSKGLEQIAELEL